MDSKAAIGPRVALIQGSYSAMTCVSVTYFVQAFQHFGIDKLHIGVIVMLGCIMACIMQPVWGYISDKTQNPKAIISGCGLIGCGLYFFFIFSGGNMAVVTATCMGIYATFYPMMSLIDSWVSKLIADGHPINYGATRSMGSVTYAVTAVLFGAAISRFGMRIAPFVFVGLFTGLFAAARGLENPRKNRVVQAKISLRSGVGHLLRNRPFIRLTTAYFLVSFTIASTGTFYSVVIFEKGGNEMDVGLGLFIMAIVEVPGMILFERIHRRGRIPTQNILTLAMLCFAVKVLAIALAPNIPCVILAGTFQTVSFALFLPATVTYLLEHVQREYLSMAQMVLTAVGSSLGAVLSNPIGGALAKGLGTRTMLCIMSAFALAGMLFFAFGQKKPTASDGANCAASGAGDTEALIGVSTPAKAGSRQNGSTLSQK